MLRNFKDKAASVCVMDIYNGDIISLVSSPSLIQMLLFMELDKLLERSYNNNKKPLTNKAYQVYILQVQL